jgi:hypothetical protein
MKTIACIPADKVGNKLFLKDARQDGSRMFVKYKSTYNDVAFIETEIYPSDGGKNCVIVGDDGTVLWRFATQWIDKLLKE